MSNPFDPGNEHPAPIDKLGTMVDSLSDTPAGEYFVADLEEARGMAPHDPRFNALVDGLQSETLGGRLGAINRFFDEIPAVELASMILPPNLSQLRSIYLNSKP